MAKEIGLVVCSSLLLLLQCISAAAPPGKVLQGPARVVDGDTLWIGRHTRSCSSRSSRNAHASRSAFDPQQFPKPPTEFLHAPGSSQELQH